jgi:histone H3/H4
LATEILTAFRGETEDLRRFNLDFSFPTPDVPGEPPGLQGDDYDDFQLGDVGPDMDAASIASGDSGGVGFDVSMAEHRAPPSVAEVPGAASSGTRKQKKLSHHGVPVPSLPSGIVKKLAARFARTGNRSNTRITKETLAAIEQASDWFFEQASEDLTMYSTHAGRRTIDESDVAALMRRYATCVAHPFGAEP